MSVARWLCLFIVLCASVARADGSAAAQKEAEARTAFRNADYAAAARAFAEAFRLDPQAATKYNEALAWNRANELAAAADAYEAALELGGLDERLSRASSDRLAELKTQLGRLVVREPLGASVSVAHAVDRGIPAKIHLAPGTHQVTVRYGDGSERRESVTITAGSDSEAAFAEPAARVAPVPASVDKPPPEDKIDNTPTLRIAGGVLLGLGGATLIAMGVTGGITLSKVSEYDDGGHTDVDLYDEARTLKTTTNVLLGVGSGLAALGAVLLLVTVGSDEGDASAALVGGPSAVGLRINW